jgi:hypothetical protein
MPTYQIIGLGMFALGIVDTAIGHLLIAPRVADPRTRMVIKVAFAISGVGISGVGLALYKGLLNF